VGGTKSIDVEAVLALGPDLVLANKEENARPAVEALTKAGLDVHVSFPCTVAESIAYLEALAELLHVEHTAEPLARARDAMERGDERRANASGAIHRRCSSRSGETRG
jgi:ABC-type hemin transport system substrate-binding protein